MTAVLQVRDLCTNFVTAAGVARAPGIGRVIETRCVDLPQTREQQFCAHRLDPADGVAMPRAGKIADFNVDYGQITPRYST